MAYSVKWSPESEITYAHILNYLTENWSQKEVESFMDRTEEVISFIIRNPKQYVYSKTKNAYRQYSSNRSVFFTEYNQKRLNYFFFGTTAKTSPV